MILHSTQRGNHVVIEVSPNFFQLGILLKCDDPQNELEGENLCCNLRVRRDPIIAL